MLNLQLHPATRTCIWFSLLLAVQLLSGMALLAACLLAPVFGFGAMRRYGNLVWRARWLLLSLVLVFAWGTAGAPLWTGTLAPTSEGLHEAAIHLGRMLLVLFVVTLFLENMPLADLLSASRIALSPLRRLGMDPDRSVIRLMLVLHYVENLPRPRDWRFLLEEPESCTDETVEVEDRSLEGEDIFIMLLLVVGVVALVLYRALYS